VAAQPRLCARRARHRRARCNALARLVRGATAQSGLGNPDLLANIAKIVVWAFGIAVAVNQIGIATELVNTLFMAVVGMFALALALSFGLGGRETAGEIVRGWYSRGRQSTPRLTMPLGESTQRPRVAMTMGRL
jgi:hypothetical protein